MPLYEYKCTKCNGYFEKLQKFSDAPPTQCDLCHETGGVERMLSTPAFHLKGGGWYKDGYSSSTGKNTKSESSSSESKPAATPAKTESKPAAAPASAPTSTK